MENYDLIEQYLAGKLAEGDKVAFENKMAEDSALKSEVAMQGRIIDSVKKARAAELKTMLSKVPVASPSVAEISVLKIAASLIGGGAILAALYFYYQPDASSFAPQVSTSLEDTISAKALLDSGAKDEPVPAEQVEEVQPEPGAKEESKDETKKSVPSASESATFNKPKIEVIDPSQDLNSQEVENVVRSESGTAIRAAKIEVDVNSSDKKHSFHYQFERGRLVLFGSFDKGLYEVIEINGDTRSLFLYYKGNYHLLDETKLVITPLEAIQNTSLIKKLTQFRGQ